MTPPTPTPSLQVPTPTELEGLLSRATEAGPWKLTPSVEWDHFGIYPATGKMEFPICLAPDFIKASVVQEQFSLIVALHNAAPALLARIKELEEALERIATGGEPRTAGEKWRKDGQPSNLDQCSHGRMIRQDCGNCTAEFARAALTLNRSEKG